MGYFVKGQGLLPVVYKSDVKIGSVIVPSAGKYLARDFGLDGASLIDVQLGELPSAITDFIGGNANVTSMIVPPSVLDVNGIYTYLFPNLEKVFLGSAANDATLKDGLDRAYAGLNVDVYVLDTLLAGYQTKYASATNLTFIAVTSTVALEIPYIEGETPTTLTADYVRQVAGDLGALATVFEKVVVPAYFTDYSSGALDEIFAQFVSLEDIESPWLNGPVNALEYQLQGSGTLTAEIVEEQIEGLGNVTAGHIVKVVIPESFTDITELLKNPNMFKASLPNIEDVYVEQELGYKELSYHYIVRNGKVETLYVYGEEGSNAVSLQRFQSLVSACGDPTGVKFLKFAPSTSVSDDYILNTIIGTDYELPNLETVELGFTVGKLTERIERKYNYIVTSATTNLSYYVPSTYATNSPKYVGKIYGKKLTINSFYNGYGFSSLDYCEFETTEVLDNYSFRGGTYGKLVFIGTNRFRGQYMIGGTVGKIVLTVNNATMTYPSTLGGAYIYVPTSGLVYYMTATNWSDNAAKMIGYLDYTDTVPTFSGYTDAWYEDEDCTTPIATSAFVSGNRYFVKLTAV